MSENDSRPTQALADYDFYLFPGSKLGNKQLKKWGNIKFPHFRV